MHRGLEVRLLGPFEVRVGGQALVPLHSRREHWLLALLILRQGRPLERAWLAGTLWPETEQSQALAYLRTSLAALRKALGPHATSVQSPSRLTLSFDPTGAEVDLVAFDAAIGGTDTAGLERAVEMYCGPLLEGCDEEWVHQDRQAREQAYIGALETLAARAAAVGDHGRAGGYLRRVIVADSLRESAHRDLMRALAAAGAHAAAIEVYRELRLHLHREVNAEPDPQTVALYEQIRKQARNSARASAPSAAAPTSSAPSPSTPAVERSTPVLVPHPLTGLIGRQADVEYVRDLIGAARSVTLTGFGGIGKTRLAIQVAHELAADFPGGVWFVELAALNSPELLLPTLVGRLEVAEDPTQPLSASLEAFLQPRQCLLVLDNCEHIIEACAQMAVQLLQACPGLKILATSREPLMIFGEQVYRVPCLAVPDAAASVDELFRYSAIQLFIERARLARTGFVVTPGNAPAVIQVCRRLDGIPLAIELAAARVRSLSPEDLDRRLDNRLDALKGGNRTALPRQQTLRALIDWSYDLLTLEEKRLLARLSVFAGGWTLAAAAAVCGEGIEDRTTDLLSSLVDKSLVFADDESGSMRYRMLETVRQYAAEKLHHAGETYRIHTAHQSYYLALAEEAESKLNGVEQRQWLDTLEGEHANMRAALAWCDEREEEDAAEAGLRLSGALQKFWVVRGHYDEGWKHLEHALSQEGARSSTLARANALRGTGAIAFLKGDYAEARIRFAANLAICREIDHLHGEAGALNDLGVVAKSCGDYVTARALYQESLAANRRLGNRRGEANTLINLGNIALNQGDTAAAIGHYEAGLKIDREIGNKLGIGEKLLNLGVAAMEQGNYEAARAYQEENLNLCHELGNRDGLAIALNNLGNVFAAQGNYAVARTHYERALSINAEIGSRQGKAHNLTGLGLVAMRQENYAEAQLLLDDALELFEELGEKRAIGTVAMHLGEVKFLQGDPIAAQAKYMESIALRTELGEIPGIAETLDHLAASVGAQGNNAMAAWLWGAVATLRASLGKPRSPVEQARYDAQIRAVRMALEDDAFHAAWKQGGALTWEEAVEAALEQIILAP